MDNTDLTDTNFDNHNDGLEPPPHAGRSRNDFFAVAIIAVFGLIATWKLFTSNDLYWGDIELYFAPMQAFQQKSLAAGIVPLWNPHIFCGEPYIGNPQTFMLYPLTWIVRLFASTPFRFVSAFGAVHICLAGVLFYPFARSEKLSRKASVLSSIVFMLGGCLYSKLQFPNMAAAIAYMPAILWCVGAVVRKPSVKMATLLGVVLGIQVLAGHAQVTLFTLYLATAYAVYVYKTSKSKNPAGKIFGWLVGSFVFAGLIASAQLLPVFDYLREVQRTTMTLSMASRFTMTFDQLANCIFPNLHGSPMSGNFTGAGNYWEPCCYVGVVAAVFALIGALGIIKRENKSARFWTFIIVLATWLSLGSQGALYIDAFYILPGLRSFHDPARFLMIASVAGAILSGLGLDKFLSASPIKYRFGLAAMAVAACAFQLTLFDSNLYPTKPDSELTREIDQAQAQQAKVNDGSRVLYDPNNLKAWRYFVSYRDFRQSDSNYIADLFTTHLPNVDMLLEVDDAGGYDPEPPRGATDRYIEAFNGVVDKGHVRATITGADELNRMAVGELAWVQLGGVTGKPGFYETNTLVILHNTNPNSSRAYLTDTGQPLRFTDAGPNQVSVLIPAHSYPLKVTIADTFLPGWKGNFDGQPIEIFPTNDGLRQTILPENSTLEYLRMNYAPSSWRIGLYLSLISLTLALGIGFNAVLSQRR